MARKTVPLDEVAFPVTGFVDAEPWKIPDAASLREAWSVDFYESIAGGEKYLDANGNEVYPVFMASVSGDA